MSEHILIIGGGVIGAMSAYYLSRQGRQVTIVDRGHFGGGCSHGNCGYVCPSHVLPLTIPGAVGKNVRLCWKKTSPLYIKPRFSLSLMRWLWSFRGNCNQKQMLHAATALSSILDSSYGLYQQIVSTEKLACEWDTQGLLFVYQTRHHFDAFADTAKMIQDNFGKTHEKIDGAQLTAMEPALKPGLPGAWFFRGDAHLRPDRLMAELKRILRAKGVGIIEHAQVTNIVRRNGSVRSIQTSQGEMNADQFIVAAGAWTPLLQKHLGMNIPIQPGKGYSITMPRPSICPRRPLIFEEHRVAITPMQTGYRIGSTMEFSGYDTTLNPARIDALLNGAKAYLKHPAAEPVQETWYGWRPMTPDSLPIIDCAPGSDNLWIAAGHNMLGVATATATGKLLSEMITGQTTHIDPAPFRASRFI